MHPVRVKGFSISRVRGAALFMFEYFLFFVVFQLFVFNRFLSFFAWALARWLARLALRFEALRRADFVHAH